MIDIHKRLEMFVFFTQSIAHICLSFLFALFTNTTDKKFSTSFSNYHKFQVINLSVIGFCNVKCYTVKQHKWDPTYLRQ